MRAALLVAASVAVLAAGCGKSTSDPGAVTFAHSCRGCHTLTGHDTASDGGDLGLLHGTVREVESFTRVMPVRPRLTAAEIHDVALYVVQVERRLHAR